MSDTSRFGNARQALASLTQSGRATTRLIKALDDCYLSADDFFVEIAVAANSRIHRDHFGERKHTLILEVVQKAHAEGWLEKLLQAIEGQLQPPDGRFRTPGPVADKLSRAVADVRNSVARGSTQSGSDSRNGLWIAVAAMVVLAIVMNRRADPPGRADAPGLKIAPLTALHFRPLTEAPNTGAGNGGAWANSPVTVSIVNFGLSAPAQSSYTYQVTGIDLELLIEGQRRSYQWLNFVALSGRCDNLCKTQDVEGFDLDAGKGFVKSVMFKPAAQPPLSWRQFVEHVRAKRPISVEVTVTYSLHSAREGTRHAHERCAVPTSWLDAVGKAARLQDGKTVPEFLHVDVCERQSPEL